MDSLLAPFQTFKARAAFPQGRVLFLCVHCLEPLFVSNCPNDFSLAASTTVYNLVYVPEESDLTEQFFRLIFITAMKFLKNVSCDSLEYKIYCHGLESIITSVNYKHVTRFSCPSEVLEIP